MSKCWRLVVPNKCKPLIFVPKRAAQRDARKAKLKEKKLNNKEEALKTAIKVRFRFLILYFQS